jgi:MHS family proline/betaine transporter-like MFS transporter
LDFLFHHRRYDFAIFGALAPEIGRNFFPSEEASTELLKSFAAFSVAFFMRPIGGIIFGYIGDTHGRKRAVYLSVVIMLFATASVGVLPTYAEVGALAPVLLVALRAVQGISVGGQLPSTILLTTEGHYENACLNTTIGSSSGNFGATLAYIVVAVLHFWTDDDAMNAWGWRVPCFLGIAFAAIVWAMQRTVDESEEFEEERRRQEKIESALRAASPDAGDGVRRRGIAASALEAWRLNRTEVLSIAAAVAANCSFVYNCGVWIPSYMKVHLGTEQAFMLSPYGSVVVSGVLPLLGMGADRFGYGYFMLPGLLLCLVSAPIFFLAATDPDGVGDWAFLGTAALASLSAACNWAALGGWLPRMVRADERRNTVVAVGYNIGLSLFGGTAPLFSELATVELGRWAPVVYQNLLVFVSLAASLRIIRTAARRGDPVWSRAEAARPPPAPPARSTRAGGAPPDADAVEVAHGAPAPL